ncbi:MAG TPA: phosphohydrolase [Roseiflexaceae bacterium]|nr:phosphohydrolase [Roseiflexaceae bacterium]
MAIPDFEAARGYAIERLRSELQPETTYHSLRHTRDDVAPAAMRLATAHQINGIDRVLLHTAAFFHDIGFVIRQIEHEAAGVAIAEAVLPEFGYTGEQIARISGMIMATRLPQSPHNLHEQILADADLDLLGTEHFWARSELLRQEYANFGRLFSDGEWFRNQLLFLRSHSYWTSAARRDRDAGKQHNARQLVQIIDQIA